MFKKRKDCKHDQEEMKIINRPIGLLIWRKESFLKREALED